MNEQAVSDKRIVTANGTGYLEFAKELLLLLENDTPEQNRNVLLLQQRRIGKAVQSITLIVWICQIGSKVLRKYSPTLNRNNEQPSFRNVARIAWMVVCFPFTGNSTRMPMEIWMFSSRWQMNCRE